MLRFRGGVRREVADIEHRLIWKKNARVGNLERYDA
jgi:hypothetical protein